MTKLIVSCDGTWNTPDERQDDVPAPTNVVRLHNAISAADARGIPQRKYYHSGVGTDGTMLQRLAGGAYGAGISANIMSAYRWLADNYSAGDEIFLFGFSRGAFTARSVAGFVGACGLPDLSALAPAPAWARVQQAYEVYRLPAANRPPITWPRINSGAPDGAVPIQFIGVWDTVGALGIPDDLALLNLLDDPKKWSFHDTQLGAQVKIARHAVAIDEMRASFTPTFWTDAADQPLNDGQRVVQLWFPGVHCDVGGGYAACGLSDGALQWMIGEAVAAGLAVDPSYVSQLAPDPQGTLHDSVSGVFKALRTRPRNRPYLTRGSPWYHGSAVSRDANPPIAQSPYHPSSVRLKVGERSGPIDIYARNHWNEAGLFLEEGGTYQFEAKGEWIDSALASDANGRVMQGFHLGDVVHLVSNVLGKLERTYQNVTGNMDADFIGTRRVETANWFALIGVVANDGPQAGRSPHSDGSPYPHQTFLIGTGPTTLTIGPTEAGYLFAYANDAWHFYDNNRGSVALTVTRIS
jgi:uncharacterized protein (DUF2235 family)